MSDVASRFWAKVDRSGDCWLWTGALFEKGYGAFKINGRNERAHRMAWRLTRGPIPDGLWVLHTCDVPACVRPDHLYLGTNDENVDDRESRGRTISRARLTPDEVLEIRQLRAAGVDGRTLAQRFGVTRQQVYKIGRRTRWATL